MSVTKKQVVSNSAHGTSVSATLTSVAAGDTIVVVFAGAAGVGVSGTPSDTQGNAYALAPFSDPFTYLSVFTARAKASGSLTVSVTAQSEGDICAVVYDLSGVLACGPISYVQSSSIVEISCAVSDFYIAAVNVGSASVESVSEPWTLDANFNIGSGAAAVASNFSSSTGTFSLSESAGWKALQISFVDDEYVTYFRTDVPQYLLDQLNTAWEANNTLSFREFQSLVRSTIMVTSYLQPGDYELIPDSEEFN